MNTCLMIIIRSALSILILLLVTKIMGKKQLNQLTIYDYVVSILIGSIAADSIISIDTNFLYGILSLITVAILASILSYLSLKSNDINNLLNGKPTILMENGEFNFSNLKNAKYQFLNF